MKTLKLFIDANIFFSAIWNPKGGSALILNKFKRKKELELITVPHAIAEATRNISLKLGKRKLQEFYKYLIKADIQIKFLLFTFQEIDYYLKFVPLKDIPILGGADKFKADFLLTLDKKHFLSKKEVLEKYFTFKVVNPKEFLMFYKNYSK